MRQNRRPRQANSGSRAGGRASDGKMAQCFQCMWEDAPSAMRAIEQRVGGRCGGRVEGATAMLIEVDRGGGLLLGTMRVVGDADRHRGGVARRHRPARCRGIAMVIGMPTAPIARWSSPPPSPYIPHQREEMRSNEYTLFGSTRAALTRSIRARLFGSCE
jgi:hypothetical protein